VAVMVALVVPAGAKAPTIDELPVLIVGSANDIATVGTEDLHLLRYNNALTLTDYVHGENPSGDDSRLKIFYSQGAGDSIQASNATALITPLSAGDIAGFNTGAIPAAAKQINAGGFNFLSVINTAAGTAPTDSYSATAAANGASVAAWEAVADGGSEGAVGDDAPSLLTLWATDYPDGGTENTTLSESGDMVVYSILDAIDSYSPAEEEAFADDLTDADGWVARNFSPSLAALTTAFTGTGLGITASASNTGATDATTGYALWQTTNGTDNTGVVDVSEATVNGRILRGTLEVSSTGAAANTPTVRGLYQTPALDHLGGASWQSDAIKPSTGNTKNLSIYWAPPYWLTEWGDGEALSDVSTETGGLIQDARWYHMQFDAVDGSAAFTATVALESIGVHYIQRPGDTAPTFEWGTGGTAFNDAGAPWQNTGSIAPLLPDGTAVVNANTMTISPGAGATGGYAQVNSDPTDGPSFAADMLIRSVANIATAANTTTPVLRFFQLPTSFEMLQGDVYLTGLPAGLSGTLPTAPATTGSDYEIYMSTTAGAAGTSNVNLNIQAIGFGVARGTFPAGTGTYTINSIGLEEIGL
jgi:hypothetical protein